MTYNETVSIAMQDMMYNSAWCGGGLPVQDDVSGWPVAVALFLLLLALSVPLARGVREAVAVIREGVRQRGVAMTALFCLAAGYAMYAGGSKRGAGGRGEDDHILPVQEAKDILNHFLPEDNRHTFERPARMATHTNIYGTAVFHFGFCEEVGGVYGAGASPLRHPSHAPSYHPSPFCGAIGCGCRAGPTHTSGSPPRKRRRTIWRRRGGSRTST